jgi:carboxyl-terminal processing protease
MGQLKITMAQFFRVNGGSTQTRGVEPDIRFPSFGDPDKYGERSMDNALPWTSIDATRYQASGDLSQLVAVADNRFHERILHDQEFEWLKSDIAAYNKRESETKISLLESVAREKMKEMEEREAQRKELQEGGDPLLSEDSVARELDPDRGEYPETADDTESEEQDEGPDLLLRESARIVADMIELESDLDLLERQFAQLPEAERNRQTVH